MSLTAARLIVGLAITLALFWTVVLAVLRSIAWFWHITGFSYKQFRRPRATTLRKPSHCDVRRELALTRNNKTV